MCWKVSLCPLSCFTFKLNIESCFKCFTSTSIVVYNYGRLSLIIIIIYPYVTFEFVVWYYSINKSVRCTFMQVLKVAQRKYLCWFVTEILVDVWKNSNKLWECSQHFLISQNSTHVSVEQDCVLEISIMWYQGWIILLFEYFSTSCSKCFWNPLHRHLENAEDQLSFW